MAEHRRLTPWLKRNPRTLTFTCCFWGGLGWASIWAWRYSVVVREDEYGSAHPGYDEATIESRYYHTWNDSAVARNDTANATAVRQAVILAAAREAARLRNDIGRAEALTTAPLIAVQAACIVLTVWYCVMQIIYWFAEKELAKLKAFQRHHRQDADSLAHDLNHDIILEARRARQRALAPSEGGASPDVVRRIEGRHAINNQVLEMKERTWREEQQHHGEGVSKKLQKKWQRRNHHASSAIERAFAQLDVDVRPNLPPQVSRNLTDPTRLLCVSWQMSGQLTKEELSRALQPMEPNEMIREQFASHIITDLDVKSARPALLAAPPLRFFHPTEILTAFAQRKDT